MEKAIELSGFFILTLLGFVVPLVGILLSVFHTGIEKLSNQYESEKKLRAKQIQAQIASKSEAIEVKEVEQSIRDLKRFQTETEAKLALLSPKKQILSLFIPLFIAFLIVVVLLSAKINLALTAALVLIGLGAFSFALTILWNVLNLLVEVTRLVDEDRKQEIGGILELLSKIGEASGDFLKKVYMQIDGKSVRDEKTEIELTLNKKNGVTIAIDNDEKRMAKKVELGLIFPSDFIIEKKDYISITTVRGEQIVRYNEEMVHGNTLSNQNPLVITAIKAGTFKIKSFIKAENVEATYRYFAIKVV